jgi:HAD superfamily hydrolase (TIGR01490 family)
MENNFSYAVFFDLDRTVLSLNSGNLLVREAYRGELMTTKDLINALFLSFLYKFSLRNTDLIIESMGKWVKGLPVEKIQELSQKIVRNYLIDSIRPEIKLEIIYHKEQKAEIILLSSAINSICDPVASHLGLNKVLCTEMESDNGILTGRPVGKFCFSGEKEIRLSKFCQENGYNLSETWYYADSISDSPVFEIVGKQVCINPDKKLRGIAKEKGWKVFDW